MTNLLSKSQSYDLTGHDFKLIYHAVDSDAQIESEKSVPPSEAVIAGIIAISEEGKIVAKLEAPTGEGYHGSPNHREAFIVLRREVERQFNEIMAAVPNLIDGRGISMVESHQESALDDPEQAQQRAGDPPTYESLDEKRP